MVLANIHERLVLALQAVCVMTEQPSTAPYGTLAGWGDLAADDALDPRPEMRVNAEGHLREGIGPKYFEATYHDCHGVVNVMIDDTYQQCQEYRYATLWGTGGCHVTFGDDVYISPTYPGACNIARIIGLYMHRHVKYMWVKWFLRDHELPDSALISHPHEIVMTDQSSVVPLSFMEGKVCVIELDASAEPPNSLPPHRYFCRYKYLAVSDTFLFLHDEVGQFSDNGSFVYTVAVERITDANNEDHVRRVLQQYENAGVRFLAGASWSVDSSGLLRLTAPVAHD